jgi:hypothetical protein
MTHHCFTFPDYQLVPILEEYSYWINLPVLNQTPFSGLEPTPRPSTNAASLHLETSELKTNIITKGGLLGLSINFLYQKVSTFAEVASLDAFDSILALLIYGLVFFPNIDKFVDINTIKIFLSKNPVLTLLADTYHFIHDRISSTIEPKWVMVPSFVVHHCYIGGLPLTYPDLLFSQQIQRTFCGSKELCPLPQPM